MPAFPLDVLEAHAAPWLYPGAWLCLLLEEAAALDPDVVIADVLRSMVDPPTLEQVLREYLQMGEYEAAQRAFENPAVHEQLGEAATTELKRIRQRHLQRTLAEIMERVTLLRLRNVRLRHPLMDVDAVAEAARRSATLQAERGSQVLDGLEEDLAAAERREAEELTRRLEEEERADAHAIARAIQTGAYDMARLLLGSGDNGDEMAALAPRPIWPYGVDAQRFVRWQRASAPDRPPGFLQQWGIRPGDAVGADLLAAIEPLVQGGPPVRHAELVPLARALERVLGESAEPDPPDWGGAVSVRGVQWPGLYVFHDPRYADGLELTHVDLEAASPRREEDRYFLCVGEANRVPAHPRAIHLDWVGLLSLVRDPNRSAGLIRLIGEQVRPQDAFPDPMPPDGGFMLGRGEILESMLAGDAPLLWVAPAGAGKTSLLRAAEREAVGRGWSVHWIDDARPPRDGLTTVKGPVLLLMDSLERLPPDAQRQHLEALMERQDPATGVRVAAAARPESLAGLTAGSWQPLPPLSNAALAAVLLHLLDALGAAYQERRVIDRMVYYAGGHLGILHPLLRHLARAAATSEDGWIMEAGTVDSVFHDSKTQEELRAHLLGWVHADPIVRLVLTACLVLAAHAGESFTTTQIETMLREYGVDAHASGVEGVLERLEAGYLLGRNAEAWRLPPNGIGTLLRAGDPEAAFMEAVLAAEAVYRKAS